MSSTTNQTRGRKAAALFLGISAFQMMSVSSFQPPMALMHSRASTQLYALNDDASSIGSNHGAAMSRRQIFQLVTQGAVASTVLAGMPSVSLAATATPAELKKLQLGHARVQYLLTNWDELTSTCNNKAMSTTESKQVIRTEGGGGGFCDKSPLIVQEYIGYKSIEDPLFKADKLMLKAVPLVNDEVMDQEDYVDLVERFREKADQTSLLAYTSSWGEANPNGGKEVVDEYLERTKDLVIETESLLKQVLKALDLEVLPPSPSKKG